MSHFLVVDDESEIRTTWQTWLREAGHTCQGAGSYEEAYRMIRASEAEDGEPFDMVLLDHQLDGGFFGINLLERFGQQYAEHRIIVITGHYSTNIAQQYAHWGVLGHQLKPTFREQFLVTITNALERRAIYVERKDDWESAVQLLEDLKLLPNIERMEENLAAFESLKSAYEQLMEVLKNSGGNESKLRESYNEAYNTITSTATRIESIAPLLEPFLLTRSFWEDIEYVFEHNRLSFYSLQSYLIRIGRNPNAYRIKHLSGHAQGHYEYRTGRAYRLYFRRSDKDIVLERFAHKNSQPEVIHFLHQTGGGDVCKLTDICS